MQLSSKVIKHVNVDEKGAKSIVTKEIPIKANDLDNQSFSKNGTLNNENSREEEKKYRNIANMIIEEARRKSEAILLNASIEAKNLEEAAQGRGYNEGFNRGYLEGVQKGNIEAEEIKKRTLSQAQATSNKIVLKAKEEYEDYLLNKKDSIKDLMIEISDSLFKTQLTDISVIEKSIYEAIETSKNTKSFIIKSNKEICAKLKDNIINYKKTLTFPADIHLLEDPSLDNNKIIIEKNNGKTIIDFNEAYENIIAVLKDLK